MSDKIESGNKQARDTSARGSRAATPNGGEGMRQRGVSGDSMSKHAAQGAAQSAHGLRRRAEAKGGEEGREWRFN